jgi:hypothetical protein
MPDAPFPLHRRSRLKNYEISEQSTPNYQFALWLKEWYEEAAKRDSKLQFAYRKVGKIHFSLQISAFTLGFRCDD